MGMYHELLSYKEQHGGSTNVPHDYRKNGAKLGRWVLNQRHFCKKKERVDLLNKIGFVWKLTGNQKGKAVNQRQWMEMYKRLEKYKQEHNSTCVPTKYDADPGLGTWVKRQRQNRNKKEKMGKERLDLLNKIGFAWKGIPGRKGQHKIGIFKSASYSERVAQL